MAKKKTQAKEAKYFVKPEFLGCSIWADKEYRLSALSQRELEQLYKAGHREIDRT